METNFWNQPIKNGWLDFQGTIVGATLRFWWKDAVSPRDRHGSWSCFVQLKLEVEHILTFDLVDHEKHSGTLETILIEHNVANLRTMNYLGCNMYDPR